MKGRILTTLAAVAALALSVATADAVTLRLSTQVAAPHPFIDVADFFKAEVEKRTNGDVTVKIFPNASLGKDDAVFNELRIGTVDLMISSTNNAAKQLPQVQIFDLYYIFPDYDAFNAATAPGSPVFESLQGLADERKLGIKFLALFGSGSRNLSVATGPVETLDDIKGLKMRTPPSQIVAKSWQAFGTVPVTVAWPELYAAIQTGVAQALESTLSGNLGSKLYEVAPYLALTQHSINGSYFAMSERSWGKLTPEQQKIVADVAAEAGLLGTKKGMEADDNLAEVLAKDHGVTVTKPDLEPFIAAITPLHEEFAKEIGASDLLAVIRGSI
ncbi:TRAP transporter substrate-binding protein [Acuticoccus kandeliae]|uniref:TRAP transporter substrate-binding protein n=1 Tax=Acuticoccus kandeliae TaxID=2073160 RepID=UPI000D3E214F|nr:TRAP transporter substrate-binding protein [Acuticoccus kandeliae]